MPPKKHKPATPANPPGGGGRMGPDRYFVNVSAFVAAGSGFCTIDPLVAGGAGNGSSLRGDTIVISQPVGIELFITSTTGTTYYPAGVALVGLNQNPDPQGKRNFKFETWDSTVKFRAHKLDPNISWKLYLLIADYSGAAPVLGLIDPDIENDASVIIKGG